MGRLPQDLEEKRQHLESAARRGAFESYIRHGRVPEAYERIAALVNEAKRLDAEVSVGSLVRRLPAGRPTTHYTWRTAGDDRVRGTHAARNGQVFSWADPPEHGHPGTEPNCRCWPEPYYGDPAVPDALLAMVRKRQVNTDPGVLWASIDTLSRPDGTLAASAVVMTDGTVIDSTFAAANVGRLVTLPTGERVRVHTEDGSQTFYVGADDEPLLQSKWSPTGPRVVRTRQHLAFLNDPLDPGRVRLTNPPDTKPVRPVVIPTAGVIGLNILVSGVSALYEMFRAAPEAMGAGDADAQIITYKTWTNGIAPDGGPDGQPLAVPVLVGSLTAEQAEDACPLLPQVQTWTDQAAFALATDQPDISGPRAGIALHNLIKNNVEQAKRDAPFMYRGVYTELSIGSSGDLASYGEAGTSRLDVVDLRPPERPTVICDFEVKTGNARLRADQLNDYMRRLAQRYAGATIYIIVVRPGKYQPSR